MLKAISALFFAIPLVVVELHAQGNGSWLYIPALTIVSAPSGSETNLGSGVSLESFFYGEHLAGGLSVQTAWSKYLDVSGTGYLKIMPRFGFGFQQDNLGFFLGGSYGLFIEGLPGDTPSLPGSAWGFWAYILINKGIALDLNADFGKQLSVGRFGLTLFSWLTLNASHLTLHGTSITYIYPGFAFRKQL